MVRHPGFTMIMRLLGWLGCSTIGGLAVILSFMNGLPDPPKAKPVPPSAAKPTTEQVVKVSGPRG